MIANGDGKPWGPIVVLGITMVSHGIQPLHHDATHPHLTDKHTHPTEHSTESFQNLNSLVVTASGATIHRVTYLDGKSILQIQGMSFVYPDKPTVA